MNPVIDVKYLLQIFWKTKWLIIKFLARHKFHITLNSLKSTLVYNKDVSSGLARSHNQIALLTLHKDCLKTHKRYTENFVHITHKIGFNPMLSINSRDFTIHCRFFIQVAFHNVEVLPICLHHRIILCLLSRTHCQVFNHW
jgi:hypothetical protein